MTSLGGSRAFASLPPLQIQKLIKKILSDDQTDRNSLRWKNLSDKYRLAIINRRDIKRQKKLELVLKQPIKLRGIDYFRIGLVFHHSQDKDKIRKAQKFAKISYQKGCRLGYWLYAATMDRLLIMSGKSQKFGTQFMKNPKGCWELAPVDPRTTNAERKRYHILPLQKIRAVVRILNSGRGEKFRQKIGFTLMRK